jgi:hypothetical protein
MGDVLETPALTDQQILALVAQGRISDDADAVPRLDGQDVRRPVWAMYRTGWVHQVEGEKLWRLTFRGRDVLQGRAS